MMWIILLGVVIWGGLHIERVFRIKAMKKRELEAWGDPEDRPETMGKEDIDIHEKR